MSWGIECTWKSGAKSWVIAVVVSDVDDRFSFDTEQAATEWLQRMRDLGKYGDTAMEPKELL